jgi:hypothetical protein
MAQFGLGNFVYELEVSDGKANFKFRDPEDATNTAEVSVSQEDFPEGITQADSRQVADLAFAQCSKVLNDKRDARTRKEAADALQAKHDEDARQREESADFLNNAQDLANTTPTGGEAKEEAPQSAPAHTPTAREIEDQKAAEKKGK